MNNYQWYSTLLKPSFAPPSWIFGPVWTVLYAIIIGSYGYVASLYFTHKIPFAVVLPFLLNVIFNVMFTPIQFGIKNNLLAAIDITLVLGTLVWALVVIYPHAKWVALVNIPYLLWVCFATVLQYSVTYLNR